MVFYFDPSVQPGDSTKLTLPWKNHFRVISKLGTENYCIKNMITGKTKIVHSENLRYRDSNDVWERSYQSARRPVQVSGMPEEHPTRQQPLRAARLPPSDRYWYESYEPAPVRSFNTPLVTPEFEAQQHDPLQPSATTASPAVPSPHLPENGEHGQLTQSPERSPMEEPEEPTRHRYALRSQGPVTAPSDPQPPPEGYNYQKSRYVPKRQRDASTERTTDKRPRVQFDMDCVSTGTPAPNVATQQPFAKTKPTDNRSHDWHSMASNMLLFCAELLFPSLG